jgi:hypothetical protein
MAVLIRGLCGLGDNVIQRAFVRALPRAGGADWTESVYLETPWPELYADLRPPLRFLPPPRRCHGLRTQQANVERQPPGTWSRPPHAGPGLRELRVHYGAPEFARHGSMVAAIGACLPPAPGAAVRFDLPAFPPPPAAVVPPPAPGRPLALVRPVTVRREWPNVPRNPRPEYVAALAGRLRGLGFLVVSVADLDPEEEWLVGEPPPADVALHRGELAGPAALFGLLARCAVAVGGVGWLLPACIALGVPAYVVLGGNGAHNAPDRLTDPRMDASRIGWAIPDRLCMCADRDHRGCDKRIAGLLPAFDRWLDARRLVPHDAVDSEPRPDLRPPGRRRPRVAARVRHGPLSGAPAG